MYRLSVVIAIAFSGGFVACGGGEGVEIDAVEVLNDRIVGGQTTGALPAVGAITDRGLAICTGTLVGPRTVLTAAHCLAGMSAGTMRFAIGPETANAVEELTVESVHPHPNYRSSSLAHDIGYMTLTKPASVAPLAMEDEMDSSWEGTDLLFVGYGSVEGYYQSGTGVKRYVWMPISQVASTAFAYSTPGKNTCMGDSGGPAFRVIEVGEDEYALYVAGVTSYGDAMCSSYGVDTRVDVYRDFIEAGIAASAEPPQEDEEEDPCQGETFQGRCVDNTVVWCENEQIKQSDCSVKDATCGWSTFSSYYACLSH